MDERLTYGPSGNVTRLLRENARYDLNYDDKNQLTQIRFQGFESVPDYNRDFTYDLLGNRVMDSANGPGQFVANFLVQNEKTKFTSNDALTQRLTQWTHLIDPF